MDLVLRAAFLYLFILTVLRLSGKRTMAQTSPFDMVLLLLVAESTDNSIIGDDHSMISTVLVISTFVILELLFTILKQKVPEAGKLLEGTPVVIARNGKLIRDAADREMVGEGDILEAARSVHGLERMEQVKYAIMEKGGSITIIPA